MSNTSDSPLKNVAAVERALSLLAAFQRGEATLTLTELANRTHLHKSTALRLLQTLEAFGYVERAVEGAYRVGLTPLQLATLYQDAIQPEDIILPALKRLAQAAGETASFNVRRGAVRVCLYRISASRRIRDHIQPGDILPLDRGAAGRILTAFDAPDKSAKNMTRKAMIVRTFGELDHDTAAMSVPVFSGEGELAGALVLSGPRNRFDEHAMPQMEQLLLESAADLTLRLGGDPIAFRDN